MKNNSEVLQDFLSNVVKVASSIASEKYVIHILSELLKEQEEKHNFVQYIKIDKKINISKKLDLYDKEIIIIPINKVFDYFFLDNSKRLFRDSISKEIYNKYKSFGIHVDSTKDKK